MALLSPSDMKNPKFLLLLSRCSYASKFTVLKSYQNQALVFGSFLWLPSRAYSGYTDLLFSARHPLQPSLWLHPRFTDWDVWLHQSSTWYRGKINTSRWTVFSFLLCSSGHFTYHFCCKVASIHSSLFLGRKHPKLCILGFLDRKSTAWILSISQHMLMECYYPATNCLWLDM